MSASAPVQGALSAPILVLHAYFWRATAEEAQKHVRGLEENAVHVKYIELVRPHRRLSAPRN